VDAAVGVDHLWQSIGVGRLQLIELAVIDDHLCDLKIYCQFCEDILACRYLSGRGLLAGGDVQFFEHLTDLFWRADVKLASGYFIDLFLQR